MELTTWIRQEHDGVRSRLHDWFVADVPLERWTERPGGVGASMVWLTLHAAVHQDLAVNVVVCGEQAVAASHWPSLGIAAVPVTAAIEEHDILDEHPGVVVPAVIAYADAVNAATAAWLEHAPPAALDDEPPASERLSAAGIDRDAFDWLHARWTGKPASWFLQWEAIGHTLLHHGEMAALRVRLGLR